MSIIVNRPKKGDDGTIIELDMQEDMSSAVEHSGETGNGIVFVVTKPSGASVTWENCTVYSDNYFRFAATSTDLDEASGDYDDIPYKVTPKFKLGSWEGHGDTIEMYVYDAQETAG